VSELDIHQIIEMALCNLLSCDAALPALSKPDEKSMLADDIHLLAKRLADQLLLAGYELVPTDRSGMQRLVVKRSLLTVQATRMRLP
jgi:hypothetical protein